MEIGLAEIQAILKLYSLHRSFKGFFRAKKDWHQWSVETLGLSSHRDMSILTQNYVKFNDRKVGI